MHAKFVKFGLLGVLYLVSASAAATSNYVHGQVTPVSGKPWSSSSASSFDWSNWTYSDNRLRNRASTARTWTVPLNYTEMGNNFLWAHLDAGSQMVSGTTGQTCMQLVVNDWFFGTRVGASPQACVTGTSSIGTDYIDLTSTTNAYVNYVVAGGGGEVWNTSWYAYGPNF